jgi:hypothetical protein
MAKLEVYFYSEALSDFSKAYFSVGRTEGFFFHLDQQFLYVQLVS